MARRVSPPGCGCLPLLLLFLFGSWFFSRDPEPPLPSPLLPLPVSRVTIHFTSTPSGAKVYLNGGRRLVGVTPATLTLDSNRTKHYELVAPLPLRDRYRGYIATSTGTRTFHYDFYAEAQRKAVRDERRAFQRRALRTCREALTTHFYRLGWVNDRGGTQADYTKATLETFNMRKQTARVQFGIVYEGQREIAYSCDYYDDAGVATLNE